MGLIDTTEENLAEGHIVLVTVGTTKFDALIKAIDSLSLANLLVSRGYTKLIIEAGVSDYRFENLFEQSSKVEQIHRIGNGLTVEWFEYAPTLVPYLDSASLVISHTGAGSIFEALRRGLPCIAVPNAILMDDHQKELVEKLAARGHLAQALPSNLEDVVRTFEPDALVPYVPGNPQGIIEEIDALFS